MPLDPFASLAGALSAEKVRYLVIGVWGANYYAPTGSAISTTLDRDLFLPPNPDNLLAAWRVCETNGFALFNGMEPLDMPCDIALARTVVERRALVRAADGAGTDVDLSLIMSGHDFEVVWAARRVFEVEGIAIPVARLAHIVESKATAGREKDRLFLATHREALESMLSRDALTRPAHGSADPPAGGSGPMTSTSSATTATEPSSSASNSIGENSGLSGESVILMCRQPSSSAVFSLR